MNYLFRTNKVYILLLAALSSCTTTTIDEFRQGETGLSNEDSVVLLGRRADSNISADFVECVGNRLAGAESAISVVPEQEFVDAMYPWFEPLNAPLKASQLDRLLNERAVAEKMAELNVRYMVWLSGATKRVGGNGTLTCALSPGGAGCFGGGYRDYSAEYEVRVWDVENRSLVGSLNADGTGTTYIAAVVVPVILPARVEPITCDRLASQLESFLVGSQ
jgi:hypothetical protein